MKHVAKKRFGQNFLVDKYIITKIVDEINPSDGDNIVEIGPGLGALSLPIIDRVGKINVIEIDRDIIKFLKENIAKDKINIYSGDALKFDFSIFESKFRLIGNLPYNISTPLLFHILQRVDLIKDIHFMLQKEVVDRICAKPNTKAYGKLSIMLQLKTDCYHLIDVGSNSFHPAPKVDSAIIRMVPKSINDVIIVNENILNQIVTNAFNQRRKTILNSLSAFLKLDDFEYLVIDYKKRAENLTMAEYVNITNYIESRYNNVGRKFTR
jgi:16S rRNA (adenine1518-N6/adenine1519-N6)-dimethyltransferase